MSLQATCLSFGTVRGCRKSSLDRRQKKWPRKSGAKWGGYWLGKSSWAELFPDRNLSGSEPETGQVAIADRDAGARHQQAIDIGHQATEERGGRREAERRSRIGHDVPYLEPKGWLAGCYETN